jgi:hypothetical protein
VPPTVRQAVVVPPDGAPKRLFVKVTKHAEENIQKRLLPTLKPGEDPLDFITARLVTYLQSVFVLSRCERRIKTADNPPWGMVWALWPDGQCLLITLFPWDEPNRAQHKPRLTGEEQERAPRSRPWPKKERP